MLWRKKRIAVIHNPHSGKNTPRFGYGKIIADILSTPRYTYDTATLGELKQAARHIHADRTDIAVIIGGDGTLRLDLTRILREYAKTPGLPLPQFVIIPTGTRNVVADNLGILSHSAVDFAKRLAAKIEHNLPFDTAHLNPLKINDEYGFMYGSALPANAVMQYYDRADYRCVATTGVSSLEMLVRRVTNRQCRFSCRWNKVAKYGGKCPKCGEPLQRVLGDERAFKVLFETLVDEIRAALLFRASRRIMTKPVYAEIALPEGYDPPYAPFMEYTGIMCSTVESMGQGFRAMPDARKLAGHFMLRCMNLSFWGFAANLPMMWGGMSLPTKSCFDAVVPYLTIKYKTPTVRTIDGDLNTDHPTTCDRIEAGPLLTFITG